VRSRGFFAADQLNRGALIQIRASVTRSGWC
jgi:hypothetical protein